MRLPVMLNCHCDVPDFVLPGIDAGTSQHRYRQACVVVFSASLHEQV